MADGSSVESAIDAATEAVFAHTKKLDDLKAGAATNEPIGLTNLLEVPVKVTVEVGNTRVPLADLVKMGPGSLVVLDREAHEPADILVNGKIVARGEVVTIDGAYGVRVTSIVGGA